jgi:hypothetical protein
MTNIPQGSMKTWRRNAGRALTAMAAALTACSSNWNGPLEAEAAISKAPDFQARRAKAEALFAKRCETAGEFIYKTVPEVKGVVWMKWRDKGYPKDRNYQFDLDDPYGADCGDELCIEHLLKATEGRQFAAETKIPIGAGEYGYDYVETGNPKDGRKYRYAMRYYRPADRPVPSSGPASGVRWRPNDARAELHMREVPSFTARYGITWHDISTHEDRENWIAGGSLSVIDLQTNEVIAKRVGYMMDLGLGSTAGFRSPWSLARRENSCPPLPRDRVSGQSYPREQEKTDFLFKVLQPTKGEAK